MRHTPSRIIAALLAVLLLTAALWVSPSLTASAEPDGGGRVPYYFSLDTLHTTGGSGSMIKVFRNLELELGGSLEAAGWLATPEGVSGYEYAWVPAGGGTVQWMKVYNLKKGNRPDLAAAGIPHASGHSTAGFTFTVEPPKDTPEGYYDVYIRGLDGMSVPCDMAAILGLRYGQPDLFSDAGQIISLPRLEREGEASLAGGAEVTENGLLIPPGGRVRLGELPLSAFEAMRITYTVPSPAGFTGGRTPILGLKTAGTYSYGQHDEAYNTTHSLVMASVSPEGGELTVPLDIRYNGEVWLTGHLSAELLITQIEFLAIGQSGDRVAAKINLAGNLAPYFSGTNRVDILTVQDPALGDVLRLEVNEATNDPYTHFNAGGLLRDHDLAIDASEYKYMVLLARSFPENPHDVMVFYLCAGAIAGATEACTHHFKVIRDGQWHYYLLDLTQTENWKGLINGMRFDIISRDCVPGQAMEFASMQFFRTEEAARAAAAQKPADRGVYSMNSDPVIIRDLSEEEDHTSSSFTPAPEDTVVVTEPPTEPPAEPSTQPNQDTAKPGASQPSFPEDTASPEELTPEPPGTAKPTGCRSAVASLFPLLPLVGASLLAVGKKQRKTK